MAAVGKFGFPERIELAASRRALIVGLNFYANVNSLHGCVADALGIKERLRHHSDGKPNYECRLLLAEDQRSAVTRAKLRGCIQDLFANFSGESFFYFSGHGAITNTGGYLATSDAEQLDIGFPMQELIDLANASKAMDILLVLDCCHSGAAGNSAALITSGGVPFATLREGATVIAASRQDEVAVEAGGHGLFTAAVLDALDGGAADHMGWVTAPSVYSYVERRFGAWGQRPVYKSHTTHLTVVRECAPLIERLKLMKLVELFSAPDAKLRLDPAYEPEDEHGNMPATVDTIKIATAHLLKDFRDAGLLRPSVAGEQLYWTARRNNTVELTARGKEYWSLVKAGRI